MPNAMNGIDKVGVKVLPCPAMLQSVRIDSAVEISAIDDISDGSQRLMQSCSDASEMQRS